MSVLENFLAGREARRQQDAADRVTAMQSFLQQNGQAIFSGDQNALGQLAGYDPQAAFAIQGQIDDRSRVKKAEGREDIRWQRELEEYAASVDAATAAKEAAAMENAVKAALAAESPEQFDALMDQFGQPELKGQFENRDALATQFMSMAEVLKMRAEPEPADEYQRYAQEEKAAGRQPLDRIGFEQAKKGRGFSFTTPDGTKIEFGGGDPKADARANNVVVSSDVIVDAAAKARALIGGGTTGLRGAMTSYNPESDAAEIYRQVDVMRANASIEALSAMRAASPTGGALGSVTEKENKMLADKAGALDPKAGPERFAQQLDDYERTLLRIVHGQVEGDRIFAATRAGGKKEAEIQPDDAPQTIADDAAYDALPSGTIFVGPDGVKRRKP